MANDCLTRLLDPEIKKSLFGEREVPDSVIKKVVQDIEAIKKNLDAGVIQGPEYKSRVSQYIREAQELSEIQLLMRSENLRKIRKEMNFVQQFQDQGDVVEGFLASLDKTTRLANEGNKSVTAMAGARLQKWGNYVTAELRRTGNMEIFQSGAMDKEIYIAAEAIGRGEQPPTNLPKEALEIGRVINDTNKLLLRDLRNAGIPTRNLEGRVVMQTHEIGTIAASGFDKWWTKTLPMLDQVRTFGVSAGDAMAMNKIGQNIYHTIVSGQYGLDNAIGDKEVGDHFLGLGATKSLADKLSEARTLHFSGAENSHAYNVEFGSGTLAETLAMEMRRNARSVSLFERFGDKPRAALEANIERKLSDLKGSDPKAFQYLNGNKQRIMNLFDHIAGTTSAPGNNTVAKIGNAIGTMETLSKLWNIGIRAASNFAGAVVELKTSTGMNILESTAKMIHEMVREIPAHSRATWGKESSEFLEDMMFMMYNEMDTGLLNRGGNRLVRFQMKYNGQNFMNNAFKNTYALSLQKEWAKNAGKAFKDLEPKMQASMLNAGIKETDWKVMAKALETDARGRVLMTPEAVARLQPEDVAGAFEPKKGMTAEKYIADLELRTRAFFVQASNVVTTTAGAREASRLNMGTQKGTVTGESVRAFMRFKSFTLQAMNISKKILNSNPNAEMLQRGVLQSQGKDMQSFAEFLVMGSLIAYGADTMLRMAHGKEAKDPTSPKTWLDSMAKSGAGGLYVDFFAGEWDRYSFLGSVAGPTIGQLGPAAKAVSQGLKKDFDGAGKTGLNIVRSYIPFQQAVGIKQGLDILQYQVIGEAMSPGSTRKHKLSELRKEIKGEE